MAHRRINLDAGRNMQIEREARQGTDPNDRPQRPFIMDGDYPPRDAQAEVYPGVFEDAFVEEQETRLHALQNEGGTLRGGSDSGYYPDMPMPQSPEQREQADDRAAYLRACHGGEPDAPEALPQPPTPFTGMKG